MKRNGGGGRGGIMRVLRSSRRNSRAMDESVKSPSHAADLSADPKIWATRKVCLATKASIDRYGSDRVDLIESRGDHIAVLRLM